LLVIIILLLYLKLKDNCNHINFYWNYTIIFSQEQLFFIKSLYQSFSLIQMLEEFIWKALDLLDKLDELSSILTNPDLPTELSEAQKRLEDHNHLKKRVTMAPVEQLGREGQYILSSITGEGFDQAGKIQGNIL
jgi:hypothetical protein